MIADDKHATRTEAMLRSIAELDARTDVGDANIDRMLMDQFELPFNDAEAIRAEHDRGLLDGSKAKRRTPSIENFAAIYERAYMTGQSRCELPHRLRRKQRVRTDDRSIGLFLIAAGSIMVLATAVVLAIGFRYNWIVIWYGLLGSGFVAIGTGIRKVAGSYRNG